MSLMEKILRAISGGPGSERGTPAPATPSQPLTLETKAAVEGQIDSFLRKVGYADPAGQTDEHGWRYFQRGSAQGRAGVIELEGDLYLRAESPVMPLPGDKDLILPLMRELLELDLVIPGSHRVGISGQQVFAAVTYPVATLHADDCARSIDSVMALADELDDYLVEKYGGTSKKRKVQVRAKS